MNQSRPIPLEHEFAELRKKLAGKLHWDLMHRRLYSTDASIYQELPAAVAIPQSEEDIRELILFAIDHGLGLIPRTAGTSLAGQVVGSGIVVDVSRHFTKIIEINRDESWVRVQPGVIRNELNLELARYGMYFAPETSTSNRAMIGGMLGNNSCGANSIVYGSTRDHVIEVRGFLANGTTATFGPLTATEFADRQRSGNNDLETKIYQQLFRLLNSAENRAEIVRGFPQPTVSRRNTGYAIDWYLDCEPFAANGGEDVKPFNFAKLIAGSEGTLFFATEIKLSCVACPPPNSVLVCAHFRSLNDSLQATQIAMKQSPDSCELIDDLVLGGARRNLELADCLNFIVDEPVAILMIEFRRETLTDAVAVAQRLVSALQESEMGYAFPILESASAEQAWAVRRAGLGVVYSQPGDVKPVTLIEDMAVALDDLPRFVGDVDAVLDEKFDATCVHYGHAGAGELHLRPNLNLKLAGDRVKLRQIAVEMVSLVKTYRGSLSGEHGDGRLRGEFLQSFLGEKCHGFIRDIKQTWDPHGVFNPGKIVDSPAMDSQLRYDSTPVTLQPTVFRFGQAGGFLSAVEMCSGSGDCRKTHLAGGTMCPSYMATRNEQDTTRARSNVLRQALSGSTNLDALAMEQIKDVMDLCLSCKGCKSECPSNVDMAKIKAEFTHAYLKKHGVPLRTRALASFASMGSAAAWLPSMFTTLKDNSMLARLVKRISGIHPHRSLPRLHRKSLRSWLKTRPVSQAKRTRGEVYLFCDEFTNYLDVPVGIATVELLEGLGYDVAVPDHVESGRSAISAGMLTQARSYAETNVRQLAKLVSPEVPLIGIEPSAILTLRDEYPDIVNPTLQTDSQHVAENTLLIDEFLVREMRAGRIDRSMFDDRQRRILLHGHCHQKALSAIEHTKQILELPTNNRVTVIPSGCCGMAGFFGYEQRHFDLSMQIGELVLFPHIRAADDDTFIAATGTSCRHQIFDGTRRTALHPVQLLHDSLIENS